MEMGVVDEEEEGYGVLLYYKYTAANPDLQNLFDFYHANCTSLSLLGRVRLSHQGVNVTVGGKMSALKNHIAAVSSNALFQGIDFKLASCLEPTNNQVARECGFTSLSIRVVKELVTLSSHPFLKSPVILNAGKHILADEFHAVLQNAGKNKQSRAVLDKGLVLLDARNLYETRIGKFSSTDVQTLDPEIRQYSDLPGWIDSNSHHLRGKSILMYCTGGIRCEMASAYIKAKGSGFENVFQLYGGIQRYMEQFPDGGFFKGKNFVFDHRVSVGSSDTSILGTCLLCGALFDDYASRCRCSLCRMLVLICNGCQETRSSYVCELCQKNSKSDTSVSSPSEHTEKILQPLSNELFTANDLAEETSQLNLTEAATRSSRKLRILCLHGFRQNASSFKGRTASLAKKLKNIAELIFIDGPHGLQYIYQPLAPEHEDPPQSHSNRKFAWLISGDHDTNLSTEWMMAKRPFDPLQHQQQTEGYEKSLEYLKCIFRDAGPFDGILGFSQGAAMAALVASDLEKLKADIDVRFVILASGFLPVKMTEDSIKCPSLHIFGSKDGKDRQIECKSSRKLASVFQSNRSMIVEHDLGHIIPTKYPYIDEIKAFLEQFL